MNDKKNVIFQIQQDWKTNELKKTVAAYIIPVHVPLLIVSNNAYTIRIL